MLPYSRGGNLRKLLDEVYLIDGYSAVFFRYFEAMMVNGEPHYTYRIKEGVTSERMGMFILKREKVIETIRKGRT